AGPTSLAWVREPLAGASGAGCPARRPSVAGLRPRWFGANETGQHLANLDVRGSGGHDRIALGECPDFLLVVGLNDAEAPRAGPIEYWAEDHHLARVDERPPVVGVAGHDLPLFVAHVEGKVRARSLQPEYKGAHA